MREMIEVTVYGAPWCESCKRLEPVLEKIARSSADVKLKQVNVDECAAPGVTAVPTVVMERGQTRFVVSGAVTKKWILDRLEDLRA